MVVSRKEFLPVENDASLTTTEVERILQTWSAGDRTAQERLWPIVFQQLKSLARRQMLRERLDHSLESGGLVNEAYLRLAGEPFANPPRSPVGRSVSLFH